MLSECPEKLEKTAARTGIALLIVDVVTPTVAMAIISIAIVLVSS